jgi:hypothetical protein
LTRLKLEPLFTVHDPQACLVHQPMVPATEQDEVVEPGSAVVGPVPERVAA